MTQDDRPAPAKRLEEARIARGFKTATAACEYFGWNYVSYSQHESGQRGLSRAAERYATAFRVGEGWLLTGEGRGPSGEHEDIPKEPVREKRTEATKGFTPEIVPGKGLVGGRDFPIYAAAMGGNGHTIITFDAIEWVRRPAILENVKDAYGIYIVGDSMEPAYEQGDMALVHPHLPPTRGTDVILYHVPPTYEAECIIKRLVGFNDTEWKLRQYNPPLDFAEYRDDYPYCHRVVGKYNGR
ncbi:S24 family peptidase [Paenochrobactrum glaciei]|uniref:Peptidase S24/S26A/S26B/S26C domain-containing protein n=1 Tax=Paenochrobactrum glaciei TaxID=486407 RepID=A0ABP3QFC6_9HYPH